MRTPDEGPEGVPEDAVRDGAEGGDADGVDLPVDGPETVAEKRLLASLGRQAQSVNLARVLRLIELLDAADAGTLDEASRQEAENLAHQLIGSAGTFGHSAASEDAIVVEDYFAARRARRALVESSDVVRVTLERMRTELSA